MRKGMHNSPKKNFNRQKKMVEDNWQQSSLRLVEEIISQLGNIRTGPLLVRREVAVNCWTVGGNIK